MRMGTARIAMTIGCAMICSPWKPKSRTSVASRATSDRGCRRAIVRSKAPCPDANSERRHNWATITGTMM